jgi:hypothetical protein
MVLVRRTGTQLASATKPEHDRRRQRAMQNRRYCRKDDDALPDRLGPNAVVREPICILG